MKKIVFISLGLCLFLWAAFKVDFQGTAKGEGCPFCREELLSRQVFGDFEGAYALLTHKPAVDGHVLIIPKRHVERFEDLTPEEMAQLGVAIQKVDQAARKAFGNSDYALIQKNGRSAGQTVPHVHFHYLPGGRFIGLRYLISPLFKPLSKDEMESQKSTLAALI